MSTRMMWRRIGGVATVCALGAAGCGDDTTVLDPTGAGGGSSSSSTTGSGAGGGSATLSDEVVAAVFIGSCVPDDGINRYLHRFYNNDSGGSVLLDSNVDSACFVGKDNGCDAVADCVGITVDLTGPCAATCSNGVSESCVDTLKSTIECAKLGKECIGGQCLQSGSASCSDAGMTSCVDGKPVACLGGGQTLTGPDCASLGLECGAGAFGNHACVGTGSACASSVGYPLNVRYDHDGLGCEAGALRMCQENKEHLVDCSKVGAGFSCQDNAGTFYCGLGTECMPGTNDASCDGTAVVLCDAGVTRSIDCTELGFTGCNNGACTPNVN